MLSDFRCHVENGNTNVRSFYLPLSGNSRYRKLISYSVSVWNYSPYAWYGSVSKIHSPRISFSSFNWFDWFDSRFTKPLHCTSYAYCTCTPYKNRCNCRCTVTFPFSPFAQEGDQIRVSYSHRIYRRFFLSPESFLTFYFDSGRVNESLQCPVIVWITLSRTKRKIKACK